MEELNLNIIIRTFRKQYDLTKDQEEKESLGTIIVLLKGIQIREIVSSTNVAVAQC